MGTGTAAEMLILVGDNPERIRSEAAFAKLCGACPIPASSGKTPATGSTAAATGRPTPPSTASSSSACAATSRPSTTSGAARPRERARIASSDHHLERMIVTREDGEAVWAERRLDQAAWAVVRPVRSAFQFHGSRQSS